MAKQTVDIGSAANAGDGEPLRDAFDKINDNFDEIYNTTSGSEFVTTDKIRNDAVDSDQIASGAIDEDHLNATNSPTDGYVLTYDSGSSGFTWEQKFDGDITGIVAGDGLTGDATSGDASLAVGAGNGITVNADNVALASSVAGSGLTYTAGVLSVDAIDTDGIANDAVTAAKMEKFDDALAATDTHILVADGTDFTNVALSGDVTITNAGVASLAADSVDHDELADRYTARASAVTTSGATTLDWSSAAIFPVTMGGDHTLNFSNYKKGQVIDIIVSGEHTITLGTSSGTPTINQVGDGTYDNSTTNLIQVVCTDDDSTPEFFYSVGTYSSDTNPA